MAHRHALTQKSNLLPWTPGRLFYIGLALVLLANMVPLHPSWYTFIHMWRVEIAASIFLGSTLIYLLLNDRKLLFQSEIYPDEWKFIVLPIIAFIFWSALSAVWAPSWKSALHHSFIWTEYLIFYFIFRQMLEQGANFRRLLAVFVATLVFYSIPAIVEYCAYLSFGGRNTLGMRFAKYGEQIVTILPIVLLGLMRTRGKQFAIGVAAVGAMWLLIFCTLGRVNYFLFGFVIAALFVGILISKRHRRFLPRFALLISLLIVLPIPLHVFSLFSADSNNVAPVIGRFQDTEGLSNSNNFRKLMLSLSKDMIADHPVVGIGADNFGMQVNSYRAKYGAANPTDVGLINAEDEIPSHAHNEFVQILAELGIVGAAIFAWFLIGVAVMAYRALRKTRWGSLHAAAAVLGLGTFLASSLVSAYSFRVMQNGIVFFFVLAIAAKLSFKRGLSESAVKPFSLSPAYMRLAFAAGIVACLGLIVYSGVRLSSVIISVRANETRAFQNALPLYQLAMRLDDENPDVRQNYGMRLFHNRRYKDAIPYLESAISIGRAPSAELSYLAAAKTFAGDAQGAEDTMAYAESLYPRSPFVLTKYATILERNGKSGEAAEMFNRALEIDERSALTWRTLIDSGPKALSELAARDPRYKHVMGLDPKSSMYAAVNERLLKHPEEQKFSYGKLSVDDE